MEVFDWEQFWTDHPRKQLKIANNEKWANLRPNDYDYKKAFDEIYAAIPIVKADKVLEIGCGTGEMLQYAGKCLKDPSKQLAAVDISQTMIETARMKNPTLLLTKAVGHVLPFVDEGFDKVYLSGVIQHIPTMFFDATMQEILRVTKMHGKIFVGDVLEKADPSAQVFTYTKEDFKEYGDCSFSESSFEHRLNVVIEKVNANTATFDNRGTPEWGTGNI